MSSPGNVAVSARAKTPGASKWWSRWECWWPLPTPSCGRANPSQRFLLFALALLATFIVLMLVLAGII